MTHINVDMFMEITSICVKCIPVLMCLYAFILCGCVKPLSVIKNLIRQINYYTSVLNKSCNVTTRSVIAWFIYIIRLKLIYPSNYIEGIM